MVIRYLDSAETVAADCLHGFFVGWPNPPSAETHLRLLASSDHIVLAVDDESGNVVGFITALTDDVLSAYIPHLEVLPAYQRQGIGSELLRRMLTKLGQLYAVDLCCDPDLQSFYEQFGMNVVTGMVLRNYGRQSG
jgi:ribosomal protein S18 acetylase RimI-like enzyme